MQAFKELYWRYSLFVLILGLGVTIFIELTPFLGGVLGAMTIYVLLRRQMHYLTACRKWRRSLAASLLLGEAVLCFLVPISLIVWMVVNQVQDIALAPESVVEPLKHIAALIHDKTGYNLWQEKNITSLVGVIPRLGQWVLGSIMDFGIPLLAVVQGVVAFVGYLVFNAPSPLFWGVLTCFATIIPIFGTALIWLPLAGYMALTGDWGPAIGLLLYGGLVVTHVDNVVRFIMQKKMADTHPLVTIFGVFIGLSLFGFMGVIFGPLMLEMFVFCVNIFKKKYLDGTSYKQLFVPEQDIQA